MSDAIFVSGLALHAYHGVMQHEAKVGQTFKLDLVLDIDLAEASRSDKLKHTVSYDTVVQTATRGVLRAPLSAGRSRRRRRRRGGAGALPPGPPHSRHRAQAARPDRRDVRRRRRRIERARKIATKSAAGAEALAEAFIALGGNLGDVRTRFDHAIACSATGTR